MYENILVRSAAAYSSILIRIDQIKVLCYETAHGFYVTKRENIVIPTQGAAVS